MSDAAQDILVFGSDLSGSHNWGDALTALRQYDAVYGRAVGLQGRSYAIPIRDEQGKLLPLPVIEQYIRAFLRFATTHRELNFRVTRIACGRDKYQDEQIASFFSNRPPNCQIPKNWHRYLEK
jgi:hypothetical protein